MNTPNKAETIMDKMRQRNQKLRSGMPVRRLRTPVVRVKRDKPGEASAPPTQDAPPPS